MWTIIMLVVIMCLTVVNMLMLMDKNDGPIHNAMDVYNHEREPKSEDLARSLHNLRLCIEDTESRLVILEDKLTYHIQSTDELKPKA
jgi:hypothetical protein